MKDLNEYIEEVRNIKSQVEAVRVLGEIYSLDSSAGENTYSVNVKIDDNDRMSGWNLFYEMVAAEKKYLPVTCVEKSKNGADIYHRDYSASAYLATYLTIPKTRQNFSKKAGEKTKLCPEYSDHLQDVYLHIRTKVIPKWVPERNDNFFAMLRAELRTVVNETAVSEIPVYWQKSEMNGTYTYSSVSFESYLSNQDDPDGRTKDFADEKVNIEDESIRPIEDSENASLVRLMMRNPRELFSKENVEAAIITSKLFGGLGSMAPEILAALENDREAHARKWKH